MTMSVVPMTLPITVTALFAAVLIAFLIGNRGSRIRAQHAGARSAVILGAALLIQPLLFTAVGFVASSTLLFTVGSHVLRGRGWRAGDSLKDIAIGLVFSSLLFLVFSRGLGVSLP